jgi:hypothetical protein
MSEHIWNVKKITLDTARVGAAAFTYARKQGADFTQALIFAGYQVEKARQSGGYKTSYQYTWQAGVRSKHRYAIGKNCLNYLVAGRRMVRIATLDLIKGELSASTRELYNLWFEGADVGFALHNALLEEGQVAAVKILEDPVEKK